MTAQQEVRNRTNKNRGAREDSLQILGSVEPLSKKPPLQNQRFKWWEHVTDFQNKLRTGLVENYDAVYVERKNQNCLWLKGFIREMSKIQIKKYRFFIRHY